MPSRIAKPTKSSDSAAVDAYIATLRHPLADGPMAPFDAKEYRRHLVIFNFHRKDCIRLVFWHGDRADDESGFLEGDYPDGRRLAVLSSVGQLKRQRKVLVRVLMAQLRHMR